MDLFLLLSFPEFHSDVGWWGLILSIMLDTLWVFLIWKLSFLRKIFDIFLKKLPALWFWVFFVLVWVFFGGWLFFLLLTSWKSYFIIFFIQEPLDSPPIFLHFLFSTLPFCFIFWRFPQLGLSVLPLIFKFFLFLLSCFNLSCFGFLNVTF